MRSAADREELEGYVVDIICLRKYPQHELAPRAREHTRECALHGHCIESGYGLVTDDGRVQLLDPHATPLVVQRILEAEPQSGIRLRATRMDEDGEQVTRSVERVQPRDERAVQSRH